MPLDDELREPDDVLGGGLDGRDDGGCDRGVTVGRGAVALGGLTRGVARGVTGGVGETRLPDGGVGSTTRDGGRVS